MCQKLALCLVAVVALSGRSPAQLNVPTTTPSIEVIPLEKRDLLNLPPLPNRPASLIGGTVGRIDPIHDRLVLRAFGGRDITIDFDVRTHVVRGATSADMRDVRAGTRVYADTILKDGRIFAKTLRLEGGSVLGEANGQVLSYDSGRGLLKVRDIISAQPISLRVTPRTDIRFGEQSLRPLDLVNGTLVQISFQGVTDGPSVAEKINVMARPGSTIVFSGRIAVIDLRDAHITLQEASNENTFEVGLHSLPSTERLNLKQGSDVIVHAKFDGQNYEAETIEPTARPHP